MQSQWNDGDAAALVARYAPQGVGADLALRVYTTRLLGGDPRLVLALLFLVIALAIGRRGQRVARF